MGVFEQKEGLFEYSKKRLTEGERSKALSRVEQRVELHDKSLMEFMHMGNASAGADDSGEESGG